MSTADVLAAIGRGLAWGAVWALVALAAALIIGRAIPRSDDDAEPVDSSAQDAAEPYLSAEVRAALAGDDWIGRMIEQGGASDFQHDGSFNK